MSMPTPASGQSHRVPPDPRRLGRSALEVGPLAYGCWRLAGTSVAAAREKLETALASGMTLIDTADIYGIDGDGAFGDAEALLGRVLAESPGLRERMVLATKGGIVPGVPYDSSPGYLQRACEASLRRLGLESVDLYQIHRPDWLAHPARVAESLVALREAGRIREVGVSNYSAPQFDALQVHLPFPIATHQPEFSAWQLAPLRDGVLDQCLARDVTPLAWSPLAGGALGLGAGEARARGGERLAGLVTRLDELAGERGVPRSAVALAFVGAHPSGAIPIVGSQQPARIREAALALEVELDASDWYSIVVASQGEPLP